MFVELLTSKNEPYKVEITTEYIYTNNKPYNTIITIKKDDEKYTGESSCHIKDNVNKVFGRRAALKNLFSKHFFSKENRRRIYEAVIPKLLNRKLKQVNITNQDKYNNDNLLILNLLSWLFAFFLLFNLLFWSLNK